MAYVDSFLTQSSGTGATSYALTLPDHVANDVIVLGVSADVGATTLACTGWTQVGTTQASAGHMATVFYKRAASSAETATITMGVADAIHVHMVILKDVDTTTALDASTVTNNATATTVTAGTCTTTTADCLILYYLAMDQNTAGIPTTAHSRPGPAATMHFLDSSDNGGTTTTTQAAGAIGWYYQRSTGATPRPVWDLGVTELSTDFTLAFRNVSGGKIPPYVDDYAENGTQLMTGTWWASATTRNNQNFKATPLTYTRVGSYLATTSASGTGTVATIGFATQAYPPYVVGQSLTVAGITPTGYAATAVCTACTTSSVSYANTTTGAQTVAGTISTLTASFDAAAALADMGINPYSYALNSTPSVSTTNPTGFECGFPTTAHDMTNGWIVGIFHASTKKMAAFNQGSIRQGGGYLTIGQGANWRTYNVMARDNQDGNGTDFSIMSVQANQQATAIGWGATQPTITAIDKILITNRGHNATGAFYYTDYHLFKRVIISGGNATYPVDSAGVADVAKFCRVPVIKRLGAAELTAYVPVQIGGGDAVNFQVDAGALQFPRIYDRARKEINYHGAEGAIGISYAGKSGDVIKHTNSVVTSASTYYWEINSAATSAATWDFSGLVVVKANVTLRNVMTFSGMAFSNCPSITATGCTLTNSTIGGVPATSASFVATSGTFTYLSVNLSTLTAGNHWWTGADPSSIFQYCDFVGGGGHAMNITAAGGTSITLTGHTFTGFGADTTTGAALNFTASSGAITVNLVGMAVNPTYKSAGATITFVNNVTVTIAAQVTLSGAEVRIYDLDNTPAGSYGTELSGTESCGTATYPYTGSAGNSIEIQVMKTGYVEYTQQYTLPAASATLDITLKPELNT